MKIIQSFYQIDNKTCYNIGGNNDNYLLNYYSMLLSYITIKEKYGEVAMYCNKLAYDKMLKYIPYDKIVLDETSIVDASNYRQEWGMLKFNVFSQQNEPFIHIDTDVFLFNDVLSGYINKGKYDGIVQSIELDKRYGVYDSFYHANQENLIKYDFINDNLMKRSIDKYLTVIGYNNGVVGFNNLKFLEEYIESAKKLNDLIIAGVFVNVKNQTMIFEQFLLYILSQKNGYKIFEVLPEDDIINIGFNETGNKHGYTHLLSGNKYVKNFILLIRNKIIQNYPNYIKHIDEFEKTINNVNFTFLSHKDENHLMKNIVQKW